MDGLCYSIGHVPGFGSAGQEREIEMSRRTLLVTALWIIAVSGVAGFAAPQGTPAPGGARSFEVRGCTFSMEVALPVDPNTAFDAMTGDISGWWDHSFVEHPKALYIEPKPGGGFYEIFDDKGSGARHATVIYAERGKRLRLDGPLGLSGRAITFVTSLDFEKTGTGTTLKLTANMVGQFDEKLQGIVEQVWRHFLVERFKPYIERGDYKLKQGMRQ
jgi:hypothetical protein